MTIPLTSVDLVILAVLGISGLFAAYRGFISEVLSVLAWGLAAIVTALLFASVKGPVRGAIEPVWLADIAAFVGLFLIALIPASFVSYRISEGVRSSAIGPLDRSLGFVFGIMRGLVIVALGYLLYAWLVKPDHQPNWVRDAKLLPIVQSAGNVLTSFANGKQIKGVTVSRSSKSNAPIARPPRQRRLDPEPYVAPEEQQSVAAQPADEIPIVVEPAKSAKSAKPKSSVANRTASANSKTGEKASGDKTNGKGYGARDRQALDQLVRSTNPDQ
jgi:membrane protein required for colicin V production